VPPDDVVIPAGTLVKDALQPIVDKYCEVSTDRSTTLFKIIADDTPNDGPRLIDTQLYAPAGQFVGIEWDDSFSSILPLNKPLPVIESQPEWGHTEYHFNDRANVATGFYVKKPGVYELSSEWPISFSVNDNARYSLLFNWFKHSQWSTPQTAPYPFPEPLSLLPETNREGIFSDSFVFVDRPQTNLANIYQPYGHTAKFFVTQDEIDASELTTPGGAKAVRLQAYIVSGNLQQPPTGNAKAPYWFCDTVDKKQSNGRWSVTRLHDYFP
jgi:hypothetical protein